MEYKIDWSSASVRNDELTVSLVGKDPSTETPSVEWESVFRNDWGRIFAQIAAQPIPGVEYSTADSWGAIRINWATITVEHVPDNLVERIKAHLEAAVERTNEEYARHRQQQDREAAQKAGTDREAAERDQKLTDRFREP